VRAAEKIRSERQSTISKPDATKEFSALSSKFPRSGAVNIRVRLWIVWVSLSLFVQSRRFSPLLRFGLAGFPRAENFELALRTHIGNNHPP
jgi:hypothetical protein